MRKLWCERTSPMAMAGLVGHVPHFFQPTQRCESVEDAAFATAAPMLTAVAARACTTNLRTHSRRTYLVTLCGSEAEQRASFSDTVAALRVPRRCCSTHSTPNTSEATSTVPPVVKVVAASEEEFQSSFYDYPIAQRVATLTVARYQVNARKQQQSTAPGGSLYMPLFDFVRKAPPLVRDDMFRRQRDAVGWVEESPLLELVDHEGTRLSPHTLTSATASPAGSEHGDAPEYNPLLHVRVVTPPEWVLRVSEADSSVSTASPSLPPSAASPSTAPDGNSRLPVVLGDSARAEVRHAVESTLRRLEERAMRIAAASLGKARCAATTGGNDDLIENGLLGDVGVPRYVPLVDVLQRILAAASVPLSASSSPQLACASDDLKGLTLESLRHVVNIYGVRVVVGQRRREGESTGEVQEHYPALSEKPFWVVCAESESKRSTVFVALRHPRDTRPPHFHFVHPRVTTATTANNFGGWGSESGVPTKADVYEILKYIPVNWGTLSSLNIPANIKKHHIRCASMQQWFRRQPFYFELRNVCGSVEIRRSVVLHPDAHGLTREEAQEVLELQLATGDANSLVELSSDGSPIEGAETQLERSAVKFLLRVCPTYFVPISLVAQRYTKKNLSEAAMLLTARKRPQDFEELTTRFSDVVLLRRRGGADSSRWRAAFVADLEQYAEDVRGIMALCNRMCPSWDRPEFIYVRLSEAEQKLIGGYAGMMRVLQRHPTIFRVGKHFVCRADPSDPLTLQEVEPAHDDVTARSPLREENPYLSPIDVALVFHYVAPEREPCTVAYLADCASPAIRSVLPTRIVGIIQLFPKLFACTETSPGVFAIRKLKQRTHLHKSTARITDSAQRGSCTGEEIASAAAAFANETAAATDAATDSDGDADLIQMLEEEIAEEEHLTKEEVIQAVRTLVPDSGVEAQQLLLWASMTVQRAANEYFGGVVKLAEALPQYFRVVVNEETKMIYRARS